MDGKQYDPWSPVGWSEAAERTKREQTPAGPLAMRLESVETGQVYPVTGVPERLWYAVAEYPDGTVRRWGPSPRV